MDEAIRCDIPNASRYRAEETDSRSIVARLYVRRGTRERGPTAGDRSGSITRGGETEGEETDGAFRCGMIPDEQCHSDVDRVRCKVKGMRSTAKSKWSPGKGQRGEEGSFDLTVQSRK